MTRRWATPNHMLLVQAEPRTNDYLGEPVPGLEEAWVYELRDKKTGRVLETFGRSNDGDGAGDDWIWFKRFRVMGRALVRFDCLFSEGMSGHVRARDPDRTTILEGLEQLPDR